MPYSGRPSAIQAAGPVPFGTAPRGTHAGVAFGLSQQSADFPLFAQLKPEVAGAFTPRETAHTRARAWAGVWAGVRAACHARLDLSHATGGGGVLDDA